MAHMVNTCFAAFFISIWASSVIEGPTCGSPGLTVVQPILGAVVYVCSDHREISFYSIAEA